MKPPLLTITGGTRRSKPLLKDAPGCYWTETSRDHLGLIVLRIEENKTDRRVELSLTSEQATDLAIALLQQLKDAASLAQYAKVAQP